jgi:hypothetical protein
MADKKKPSLADLKAGLKNAKKTTDDRLFEKNVGGTLTSDVGYDRTDWMSEDDIY